MYCPEYIRKLSVKGSVSMSAREQVLMKIIANLRRLRIDISNSKFKDKWSAAFTSITRLEQNAKELGINSFLKPFEGIRAAVIQKNICSALQNLAVVNNKKSQILKCLG